MIDLTRLQEIRERIARAQEDLARRRRKWRLVQGVVEELREVVAKEWYQMTGEQIDAIRAVTAAVLQGRAARDAANSATGGV